jgi:Rad3-related DNA helicase
MPLTVENFRREAPKFLHSQLSKGNNALIDAPPGLGKTRAGAKVGLKLTEDGEHRVVIIEPTKTLRSQVVDYIKDEKSDADVHESKGWNDYPCPIIAMNADPSLCSTRKDICREESRGCGVLKDIDKTKASRLTVATFPKLLLSKGMFSDYDTVIIDESHGFENAETTFLQTYVMIDRIGDVAEEMKTEYPDLAAKLQNIAMGLARVREALGDTAVLTPKEIDSIREVLGDENLKSVFFECVRGAKFPRYRTLYNSISTIHFRMQNIYNNVFFFYEGALYSRPKNMSMEVSRFFRDKNVGLLSATVDDPLAHARSCGLDLRRFNNTNAILLRDYPDIRRKNRLLLGFTDGPNLSRSSGAEYESSRDAANKILHALIGTFKIRTLVLFRGYNDHKDASEYLAQTEVKERILNISQGEDPDVIDDKIRQLRKKNVVLSSASTRLWEGVDIPELRLLIIDALPYPGKDPLDTEYDFRAGYHTMVKKLKQGLGRIVRSDEDWGAAVVIDRRFHEHFPRLSSKLPWHMGEDFKRMPFADAMKEIETFVKKRDRE